ncbi:hypothetical protein AGMMS50267_06600 [Spirochaetia bacterium]|nr:hypothetical protein AGMMS50267_06600 [Spirochaetia bacterium]
MEERGVKRFDGGGVRCVGCVEWCVGGGGGVGGEGGGGVGRGGGAGEAGCVTVYLFGKAVYGTV